MGVDERSLPLGLLNYAPDYESERPVSPLGRFSLAPRPSDPRETAVQVTANMVRKLKSGQTLTVTLNPEFTGHLGTEPMFIVTITEAPNESE